MVTEWRELRAPVGSGWLARRRESGHLCFHLCAAVAFCLVVLLIDFPETADSQSVLSRDVVKVAMFRFNNFSLDVFSDPIIAGFTAALWSRNYTLAEGVSVEIVERNTSVQSYAEDVDKALSEDNKVFAIVGHIGDVLLQRILPTLQKNNVVAFAPFTGSSTVRGWNPNLYFLRPDPAAELLALIHYAFRDLRVLRLGFMYLSGVSFGEEEYEQAKQVILEMGHKLSGVFIVRSYLDEPADNEEFDAAWERFADTLPQAVIVFTSPIHDTVKFLRKMLRDNRTANAYLLAPSSMQNLILTVWPEMMTEGVPFRAGQVITTGTNPLASDTTHKAVKRFQNVMKDYLGKRSGHLAGGIGEGFLDNDHKGELMVYGWIVGEVLSQALSSREWLKDRKTFLQSIFNQRQYLVDDIVTGTFGGECNQLASSQGAMCFCNQGGRAVYMKRFAEDFRVNYMEVRRFKLRYWECYTTIKRIAGLFNGVSFSLNDYPYLNDAASQIVVGNEALKQKTPFLDNSEFTLSLLQATLGTSREALLKEIATRSVHAVAGIVTEAMLDVTNVTFIDPLQIEPRLNRFQRNVIRLSPTLEQEFFVIAHYLGNTTGASVHAVVRVSEAAAVADVLRRSLVTFGGSLLSTTLLTGGDALEGHLPREGGVFVVGLSAGDVGVLARHLAAFNGVRVFVVFSELAVLYADFVAAFGGGESADRLVFATSLPHWSDDNTSSLIAKKFMTSVRNETHRTPLALMSFASTRLVHSVVRQMGKVSSELFDDFIYKNVAVSVDDMVYGPFADSTACAVDGVADSTKCDVNYGATSIAVWSLARVFNPSIPPLTDPITPSMEYTDPDEGGLTGVQLTGVVIGSVLLTLLLVVIVTVLICRCRNSRDNRNAPKERTDPVTLVFTDIESSTALWAGCPEVMPDAVATHHRLIRSLITKYRCYEVKTIGDSFMIACRSVFAAVQLAREVQQVFMKHDWGTTEIDDAYRVFEERRAAEDEEYVPPTARLDAAVYRRHWNGVRVRAGVHTGLCDIRHDPVTKGYDYYGDTSNTAARTESVANGGQVLLTRAAYMALSTAEREEVEVTALGAVALRGVPRLVEMYQLDAVPGRTFAALRLEREAVDIYTDTEICSRSVSSASNNDSSIACENPFFFMITDLLSPLSLPQRQKVLEMLCQRWGVPVSFKKSNKRTEVCHAAICRLAIKLARVTARRAETQDGEYNFGLCSFFGSIGANSIAQYEGGDSVTFDASAPMQPYNRTLNRCELRSYAGDESTTTIICRPPLSLSPL